MVTSNENDLPEISVVIPMLDAEATLPRCLAALDRQENPPGRFERLVVDNGSSDASVAIARAHAGVTLLEEPRRGAYAARNRGLAASRGAILAFVDPDCEPGPRWLARIAEDFRDPEVRVVCGRRRVGRGAPMLESLMDYEVAKDERVLGGSDAAAFYGFTCNMAVRREVFDVLGAFADLQRGADTLLVRAVASRWGPQAVRFDPEMEVVNLELDGPVAYWKKVFLYGLHRRRNNAILASRPLSGAERLEVFRDVIRRERYSPPRAAALLLSLAIGAACWRAGWIAGRLAPRPVPGAAAKGPGGTPPPPSGA